MKRRIKKDSGVCAFLNASGILENGSNEEIEQKRKQYWTEYRRRHKKIKRQECRSFEIFLSQSETKKIKEEAKKHHTSPTNYIKQSAITNKHSVLDWFIVGEIRELVTIHHNTLLTLTEENSLSEQTGDTLIKQISAIEKKIFTFFLALKQQ
jgi:hypothetical protein